jgi:hypothetical protein
MIVSNHVLAADRKKPRPLKSLRKKDGGQVFILHRLQSVIRI